MMLARGAVSMCVHRGTAVQDAADATMAARVPCEIVWTVLSVLSPVAASGVQSTIAMHPLAPLSSVAVAACSTQRKHLRCMCGCKYCTNSPGEHWQRTVPPPAVLTSMCNAFKAFYSMHACCSTYSVVTAVVECSRCVTFLSLIHI